MSPESSWLAFCLPGDDSSTPRARLGVGQRAASLHVVREGQSPRGPQRALSARAGWALGTPLRAPLLSPAGKWHLGHHGSYHPSFRGKDSPGDRLPGEQRCLCEKILGRLSPESGHPRSQGHLGGLGHPGLPLVLAPLCLPSGPPHCEAISIFFDPVLPCRGTVAPVRSRVVRGQIV